MTTTNLVSRVRAFALGASEAGYDTTTHYDWDEPGADAYEYGRRLVRWVMRWN